MQKSGYLCVFCVKISVKMLEKAQNTPAKTDLSISNKKLKVKLFTLQKSMLKPKNNVDKTVYYE